MVNYGIQLTTTVAKKIFSTKEPKTFFVQTFAGNSVDIMIAQDQSALTSQGDGIPGGGIVCPASAERIILFRDFTGDLYAANTATGTTYLNVVIWKDAKEIWLQK
jgi:hypothetical protein